MPHLPDAQFKCLTVMYTKHRIVNPRVGYPLTHFCDLVELLGAFQGAVESHKHLYGNGILHRDINPTKILLTGDTKPGDRSFIVDFDDAVCPQEQKIPGSAKHTATPAFMSFEMLADDYYFRPQAGFPQQSMPGRRHRRATAQNIPHAAVHDLDSLFWVFCWICATRAGPGTPRSFSTTGLTDAAAAETHALQREIEWTIAPSAREGFMFDARRKHVLFDRGAFGEGVLDVLAPYFAPVRPLVVDLYERLRDAFERRRFGGLHEGFGEALVITGAAPQVRRWHARAVEYGVMERAVREWRGAGVRESLPSARVLREIDVAIPGIKRSLPEGRLDLHIAELSASARPQTGTNTLVTKRAALRRVDNVSDSEDNADVEDNAPLVPKARRARQRKNALRARNL